MCSHSSALNVLSEVFWVVPAEWFLLPSSWYVALILHLAQHRTAERSLWPVFWTLSPIPMYFSRSLSPRPWREGVSRVGCFFVQSLNLLCLPPLLWFWYICAWRLQLLCRSFLLFGLLPYLIISMWAGNYTNCIFFKYVLASSCFFFITWIRCTCLKCSLECIKYFVLILWILDAASATLSCWCSQFSLVCMVSLGGTWLWLLSLRNLDATFNVNAGILNWKFLYFPI